MHNRIDVFVIRFSNELRFNEVPMLRSGVLSIMEHDANVLFHNHLSDDGFRYSYPLIQYKRINRKAAIVCFGEGCNTVGEFFATQNMKFMMGEQLVELNLERLQPRKFVIQVWDTMFTYTLRKWLPFNQDNYRKYTSIEGVAEKALFLQNILIGNMLSMTKGLGIHIDKEILCNITEVSSPRIVRAKGVKLMSFDIEFKSNLSIPDYAGIGKHASIGYGTIVKKRNNNRNEE